MTDQEALTVARGVYLVLSDRNKSDPGYEAEIVEALEILNRRCSGDHSMPYAKCPECGLFNWIDEHPCFPSENRPSRLCGVL